VIDTRCFELVLQDNTPLVMGIINCTPDSFSGDGVQSNAALIQRVVAFEQAGVAIIDIGAESSRPGAQPISSKVEMARLSSAVALVREHSTAFISVDTYKAETAQQVLRQGADIINDISGGESDELLEAVAQHNATVVLMHKQGAPQTMQNNPCYDHVVDDVYEWLSQRVKKARQFGIRSIIVDPGIGFGKTFQHNMLLLKHLNQFTQLGCPLLIGTSNKSFIGQICNADVHHRQPGSIASALDAYAKGARVFRVHDVAETVQALAVVRAINE
jgi:dihydropteroate synthase